MSYPTLEQLINRVWPQDPTRNVNTALDNHEKHYGLHHTEQDILKGIGQHEN